MENFSYHVPFYVVTGGVATSGHSSDLSGAKVGLFDRSTFSVATGVGNGKEFFFAQGTIGGKDWYGVPVSATSHKSAFFFGKDVEDMYLSRPQRIINEEWVLGYNGSPSSVSLSYVVGKPIRVAFLFTGDPIYRFFGGPKEYLVSYTPPEDCLTPCETGDCPDGIGDCLTHTQKLIDNINNHTELKKFGVIAKLVTADFAAASATMIKWCLTLCDNGDPLSLQVVKAQAPAGVDVIRTARVGSQSTYQFCKFDDEVTPAAFQQTSSILQAVCDTCPAGSFLIGAKDVYIVKRPIVGGEDFTTAASRDTYANVIWTAYATANSITTSTTTTSTTTAAGTFNADATFVGQDGSLAIVKLKFAAGSTITALGADLLEFSHTEAAVCVFAAPASVAWASCGTGIRSQRTLKIKNINRPDCDTDGDRLDDLTNVLSGVVGIQINTLAVVAGDACKDDYTVDQFSVDCLDEGCLTSNVTFTYDDLPAFENEAWEVVPPVVEADNTRKCGIRVTAGYIDPRFGDCSFNPMDYYETQPLKFELSLLGEDWSRCDFANRPSRSQSRIGRISRQSGEYVVREVIMKTEAYQKHINQFSLDPREREAFDKNLLALVDRTAYYNLYYVRYKASYGRSFRKNEQEKFTTVFAFKEGDAAAELFESQVLNVLTAKSGVSLHINGDFDGGSSGQQGIGA